MAIAQALCNTFKKELFTALHDFSATGGNAMKIALFTSAATLGATTTTYATPSEATGTGYTAGGMALVNVEPANGGTTPAIAYLDFDNATWTGSTITARGAMIYNSTNANRSVIVLDFTTDKSSSNGDFTIQFPAAAEATAIIRIN